MNKLIISIAILVMGFSGLVSEILLLRELLIVYSGNELCVGIILANWLILEAFGSYYIGGKAEASKNRLETFIILTILFCLSLPAAVFLIRNLKTVLGVSLGESIGFIPMFWSSFLILLPTSVLHGTLFTYGCRIYATYSKVKESSVGKVYVFETIGTIIGGIVCTYFLIPYFNTFQGLLWLALLNCAICLVVSVADSKLGLSKKILPAVLSVFILACVYSVITGQMGKLHRYSIKSQWINLNLVHYQNSQFGNICVVENQGQYIFFQDGIPGIIAPVPDLGFIEEFVHLPLLTHPEPSQLLILGGGAGGIIYEALKHPVIESIEYAELDPLLLELLSRFPTTLTKSELTNEKVRIKNLDGRLYLNMTAQQYDVILVGITNPSDLQANRFFTKEFFTQAKTRLNKAGILVIGLPGSLTFANEELKNLNSCITSSLKSVFPFLRVIPGNGTNIFFASDSLDLSKMDKQLIMERLIHRGIEAEVMVPWHIENKLHQGWQTWFDRFIDGSSRKINSDFSPIGLFYSTAHWNALFAPSLRQPFKIIEKLNLKALSLSITGSLLLFLLFRQLFKGLSNTALPFSIITTGFAGMIFDLMLIFTFQSIYGYVFMWIGLLVAFFMAGAAIGAIFTNWLSSRIHTYLKVYLRFELALIGFSFGWPFLFLVSRSCLDDSSSYFLFRIAILVVSSVCGLLTGSQFPLANKIHLRDSVNLSKTAGLFYAADLLGGWFGGVLGALVLLPVLGLSGTCFTVGLLKLTSFIILVTQPGGTYGR